LIVRRKSAAPTVTPGAGALAFSLQRLRAMLATRSLSDPVLVLPINVFQAGGGLVNAGRDATLLEIQVLLDGRVIQDTRYAAPSNVADVTGGLQGILPGPHVLALKIVRQTGESALYQSYVLSVIVGDTTGRVLVQKTFADRYARLRAGGTMEFAFRF
jgi:hypothetical protein